MRLTRKEMKCLKHIAKNGHHFNMKTKDWSLIQVELMKKGLLTRQSSSDFNWIVTDKARRMFNLQVAKKRIPRRSRRNGAKYKRFDRYDYCERYERSYSRYRLARGKDICRKKIKI